MGAVRGGAGASAVLLALVLAVMLALAAGAPARAQSYTLDSLRASALRGADGVAALALAEAYRFGRLGLTASADSERVWVARAARLGQPEALYLQGVALLRGQGVKRNMPAGLALLDSAARRGDTRAARLLVELYADTTHRTFDAELRPPLDWRRAAHYAALGATTTPTQRGDAALAYHLGWSYLTGRGLKQNDSLAIAWLDSAARRGQVRAQLALGDLFLQGSARTAPDLARAAAYYRQAATHPTAEIEATTAGRVGLHHVEQLPRAAFNHSLRLNPFWPWGALELRYRK